MVARARWPRPKAATQASAWGYVASQLYNNAEAEDLTQEVFITAWRDLAQFRPDGDFAAWLRGRRSGFATVSTFSGAATGTVAAAGPAGGMSNMRAANPGPHGAVRMAGVPVFR